MSGGRGGNTRPFAFPWRLARPYFAATTSISTRKPDSPGPRRRQPSGSADWLGPAEKLRVALHEGVEIHRRAGVVDQKNLPFHHVAHAEAETLENGLDLVQRSDRLRLHVAIGLRRGVRHGRRSGSVRQRGDGCDQGHRRTQHRHAVLGRPGLRGLDRAPRRLRRAARQVGRLVNGRERRCGEQLGRARAGRRARPVARSFTLTTVVWRQGPSSSHQGHAPSSPRPARSTAGSAERAPSRPSSAKRSVPSRTASRGSLLLGTPGAVRRRAGGHDGHPDLVPERRRDGGLRRAGAGQPPPRRRRALADGAHVARPGAALGWRSDLIDGADFTADDVDPRVVVVVATQGHGDEEAIEAGGRRRPGLPRAGRVAQPWRGRARLPRRSGRAARAARPGARAGRPRPRPHVASRDRRRRSSPSWSSCAPSGALAASTTGDHPTCPWRRRRRSTRCAG